MDKKNPHAPSCAGASLELDAPEVVSSIAAINSSTVAGLSRVAAVAYRQGQTADSLDLIAGAFIKAADVLRQLMGSDRHD